MTNLVCPLCGSSKFKDYRGRVNAACAKCNAKERHRLLGLVLPRILPSALTGLILHMAPELGISRLLFERYGDQYRPVDIFPDGYCNIPVPVRRFDMARPFDTFGPDSADVILHSHVLEHIFAPVQEVIKGLNALIRPGGFHIIQIPIRIGVFDEDLDAGLSGEQRERRFGQHDHVRWFGDQDIHEKFLGYFDGFAQIDIADLVARKEIEGAGIRNAALSNFTSDSVFVFQKQLYIGDEG